jgi:hypothetical protein
VRGLRLVEVPITCDYRVPEKRSAYRQGFQVLHRLSTMVVKRRILHQTTPNWLPPTATAIGPEEREPVVALSAD